MIQHKLDVKDFDQNIVRPLILKVVESIKEMTGITANSEVIFAGMGQGRAQYTDETTGRVKAVPVGEELVQIDVTSRFEEGPWSGQATHRAQHRPFFNDPETPFSAKPGYRDMEAQITVTYVTHSGNEAERWRNAASNQVSQWGATHMHSSSYQYIVPRWVWAIAKHMHTLREMRAPYNETFEDYIRKYLSPDATQITDQAGKNTDIAIRETQRDIQGLFDFTSEPEPVDKNDEQGNWRVRFGYKLWFSVPTFVSIEHPLLVHNTVVDQMFIPRSLLASEPVATRSSIAVNLMEYFECDNALRQSLPVIPAYYSPAYDKWTPGDCFNHYKLYGSFLVGYTDPNQTVLLDLKDLGMYQLSDVTLKWLAGGSYKNVTVPYSQPFYITLYENESPVVHTTVSVDENLQVVVNRPLNMRKRYRVVVFIATDLTKVNWQAVRDMTEHPDFTCSFLRTINANMGDLNRFMLHVDLSAFKQCVLPTGPTREEVFNDVKYMSTVMNASIIALRR